MQIQRGAALIEIKVKKPHQSQQKHAIRIIFQEKNLHIHENISKKIIY